MSAWCKKTNFVKKTGPPPTGIHTLDKNENCCLVQDSCGVEESQFGIFSAGTATETRSSEERNKLHLIAAGQGSGGWHILSGGQSRTCSACLA
jgi:hypothetical protein